MQRTEKLPSLSSAASWTLTLIPIVALALFVWHFSTNAPYGDDYDAILNATLALDNSHSVPEFFHNLTAQHNEHRIVPVRLLSYLYAKLFGTLNFKIMIALGFLQIVALLLLLGKIRGDKLDVRTLWPVSLLLFQPSYHETILWAETTWSNTTVILFAFFSLYMLLGKRQVVAGAVLALVATYSQANGILTFVAGAAGLLAQQRYRELPAWLVASAVAGFCFFYGYHHPPNHPPFDLSLPGFWHDVQFFVLQLGSIGKIRTTCAVFGVIMLCAILFLAPFLWRKQALLGSLILFLLMTAASAALARSQMGVKFAVLSRYTIISVALLILLYLAASARWSQRTALATFGVIAIIVNLYQWSRSGDQSKYAHMLAAQAKVGDSCYQNIVYPAPGTINAVRTLAVAESQGIYFLHRQAHADTDATVICLGQMTP